MASGQGEAQGFHFVGRRVFHRRSIGVGIPLESCEGCRDKSATRKGFRAHAWVRKDFLSVMPWEKLCRRRPTLSSDDCNEWPFLNDLPFGGAWDLANSLGPWTIDVGPQWAGLLVPTNQARFNGNRCMGDRVETPDPKKSEVKLKSGLLGILKRSCGFWLASRCAMHKMRRASCHKEAHLHDHGIGCGLAQGQGGRGV